jgi:hypothetical protein
MRFDQGLTMNVDQWTLAARRASLLLACVFPIGCSNGNVRVYPVRGEVFVNGKPAKDAVVHFHPHDKVNGPPAFAIVQGDGSFQLTTYTASDGAATGDYVVTLTWRVEKQVEGETIVGPDRLKDRYSKPESSRLNAKVTAGDNVLPRFDLK